MPYISRQQLIEGLPNISPETVLMINNFYSTFDNRSAANRRITNVEPLFYIGAIAGSEYLTYAVTKLYLCFHINIDSSNAATINHPVITFHSELNVGFQYTSNGYPAWDNTAGNMKYHPADISVTNLYFSRLVTSVYTNIKFIGYRITLA